MNSFICLSDENIIHEEYDQYIITSANYLDTIRLCEEHKIKYHILDDYWETVDQILDTKKYLDGVKAELVSYATRLLNEYHNANYKSEEWNIVLNAWLETYLVTLFEKYTKILTLKKKGYAGDVELCSIEKIIAPLDYPDFLDLVNHFERYNLYLSSLILDEIGDDVGFNVINRKEIDKPERITPKKTKGYYKTLVYRTVLNTIKRVTGIQDRVVLKDTYLSPSFLCRVMWQSNWRVSNYMMNYLRFERVHLKETIDTDWRNSPGLSVETEDAFTLLALKLLKKNIPIAYVEDFKNIQKKAKKCYKYALHPKAVLYVDEGLTFDEIFKNYLMQIKGTGALLCDLQHGGNYGIDHEIFFAHERELSDRMYTWGWTKSEDPLCEYKPMPASKLINSGLEDSGEAGQKILYVNYTAAKNVVVLHPDEMWYHRELRNEVTFFRQLKDDLKKNLVVRLFQEEYGWQVKQMLDENVEGLIYDQIPRFYDSLKDAKLVILTRWSTTIIEALYANKPILVLRKLSTFDDNNAKSDLIDLKRVGVLVETWEELATQLNTIYDHIDEWWSESERRDVVGKIMKKYIYMPASAGCIWREELMRLAD